MSKVFLGGTCNDTDWRSRIKPLLKIEYFDPVITDREWTEQDRLNEIAERARSDFVLYVFTPKMTGLYSIAELIDDSNKRPHATIVYVQEHDTSEEGKRIVFIPSAKNSMIAVSALAKLNGAKVFGSLEDVAAYLNSHA